MVRRSEKRTPPATTRLKTAFSPAPTTLEAHATTMFPARTASAQAASEPTCLQTPQLGGHVSAIRSSAWTTVITAVFVFSLVLPVWYRTFKETKRTPHP